MEALLAVIDQLKMTVKAAEEHQNFDYFDCLKRERRKEISLSIRRIRVLLI